MNPSVDIAVIGAGSAGIAVAFHLVTDHGLRDVVLVDPLAPMSLTSAQSGENYRNWWPHPVMTAFTDHSIDLMEALDVASGGRLAMTRGGYVLATRRGRPADLIDQLHRGYGAQSGRIRVREFGAAHVDYVRPRRVPWSAAPDGVDVLLDRAMIREHFPACADDIATVIHIRRAGSLSTQQLGQYMLERIRPEGVRQIRARVTGIAATAGAGPFTLELDHGNGTRTTLRADRVVNAAGPYLGDIGAMMGETLPVRCVYQQKIAFVDREAAVPRTMPFTIDLDGQTLSWSDEDRALLASDPLSRRLVEPMIGGIHCRPDGPAEGQWVKLGWAYNDRASDPHGDEPLDPQFPDTVLRGASRLNPKLAVYLGRLPRGARHYGGYYTMTDENWPLIGPMATDGAFVAGALSGFGSMAACATGALCAAWVAGKPIPAYARWLAPDRRTNTPLMATLSQLGRGTL